MISLYGESFNNPFIDFISQSSGIEKIHPNQNALKLLDSIPPELRDLPYATYPNDITYNTLRFNFNKRFNVFPKAIISPRTFEEAQYVLNALRNNGLDFAVRSGGHCFEPGSLSSDYIFDLRNFKDIIPDVENEEVYIGAGCLLNQVIETLGAINYAIPTGTCPTVCVTGLTLGGGIGLLTRTYGLTCDSVKNIIVLTSEGEIINVNEDFHSDLFWALKGGGNGSYGIVLGFTFKMHYLPVVTFFELFWEWQPHQAIKIIQAWQEWVKGLPDSISTSLRLEYKEGKIGIKIIGIKKGKKAFTEWEKTFKVFSPVVKIYHESYVDTAKYWATEPTLPFNKIKSKILLKPLSKKVIRQIVNFLEFLKNELKPDLRVFLNFDGFGGRVPDFNNAFAFKDAFGWWYQAVYWPLQTQEIEALKIINHIYDETSSSVSPYSYANATDYDLGKRYLKAYYANHVDRLIHVKNQYDPHNLFHWKQSIPLRKPVNAKNQPCH
jgi:hypothetical protein